MELTPSATLERVIKLEERGLIKGYMALLDPHALGLGSWRLSSCGSMTGTTRSVRPRARPRGWRRSILRTGLHHLAGEDCFLVKVRARDTDDLYRILKDEFGRFKTIRSTRTTIVLKTVKETPHLAVGKKVEGV